MEASFEGLAAAAHDEVFEKQQVQVFERQEHDVEWRPRGSGGVMWSEGVEGLQTLLVVGKGSAVESGKSTLAQATLPDPELLFRIAEGNVVAWSSADASEVALVFSSAEGFSQVWEDIQMLQSLDPQDQDPLECAASCQLPDKLPEPTEATLPQLVYLLTLLASVQEMQHPRRQRLLLALLQSGEGGEDGTDGARDYVRMLQDIFESAEARYTASLRGTKAERLKAAQLRRWEVDESDDEEEADAGERSGWGRAPLEQLAQVVRLLFSLEDELILRRLLQDDTSNFIFGALEYEAGRAHLQTTSVNSAHRAYVASDRFRMPIAIRDPAVLRLVHQNFRINYLMDGVLALSAEPTAVTALSTLRATNTRQILLRMHEDEAFLQELFDAILQEAAVCEAAAAANKPQRHATLQLGDGCMDGAATNEGRALQLWSLLRELCMLASSLNPLLLSGLYHSLLSAGLLPCVHAALSAPYPPELHVRSLDVLIALCQHDPSICRHADITATAAAATAAPAAPAAAPAAEGAAASGSPASAAANGEGAAVGAGVGAGVLGALVELLAQTSDEGVVRQVIELLQILLEPSAMEPNEQNTFLDLLYNSGRMQQLLELLCRLARETTLGSAGAHARGGDATGWTAGRAGATLRTAMGESHGGGSHGAKRGPVPSERGATVAGATVALVKVEVILELLSSNLDKHGYRGLRLAQDESLWNGVSMLLEHGSRWQHCCAVRFTRIMLTQLPQCAARVAEMRLMAPMLRQLLAHGSGRRDNLCNSAILLLMHLVTESAKLTVLRLHLLRHHRAQLQALCAAGVCQARQLLVFERSEACGGLDEEMSASHRLAALDSENQPPATGCNLPNEPTTTAGGWEGSVF